MYTSASNYRAPGRSRRRSRTQSDPGHPYVSPPYTVQWPAPARQTTEPVGITNGMPHQHSPSRSSSVERNGDPFVPSPGSLLSHHQMANSPGGHSPSTSVSPRSPSAQGSIMSPQGPSGPLIKDVPQPPRTAFNVPTAVTAAPHPYPATWGQAQAQGFPAPSINPPAPTPFQSAGMQRQGSHHTVVYQQPAAGVYQISTATHHSQHYSDHHQPAPPPPHPVYHRSRSRPPSAASHRYASSFTQPMYGHGSSASLNASRTSLNGGMSSQRNHHATSPPPATSVSHHPGTGLTRTPSESPQRSHSQTRVLPSSTSETAATPPLAHRLKGTPPSPPSPPPVANELHRSTQRPQLLVNYDGQTQTRYVNMLLALDDISPLFNIYASFFTWILLAGFVLFPGTFASWQDQPVGSAQSDILNVVNHVSLYVIAWICTGIGGSGMIWLWWRWQNNYIWITNRIFVPGFLNSVAGVISTLSSVYGAQAGVFGKAETSTIIVTGATALICAVLVMVYEFWLLRNLKLEHDQVVGVEIAGKHGEGVLGMKRDGRN